MFMLWRFFTPFLFVLFVLCVVRFYLCVCTYTHACVYTGQEIDAKCFPLPFIMLRQGLLQSPEPLYFDLTCPGDQVSAFGAPGLIDYNQKIMLVGVLWGCWWYELWASWFKHWETFLITLYLLNCPNQRQELCLAQSLALHWKVFYRL